MAHLSVQDENRALRNRVDSLLQLLDDAGEYKTGADRSNARMSTDEEQRTAKPRRKNVITSAGGSMAQIDARDSVIETSEEHIHGTISYGDRLSLRHEHNTQTGYLNGNPVLRRCGVEMEPRKGDSRDLPIPSLDFRNNVFAILPMMMYRAQGELHRFERGEHDEGTGKPLLETRAKKESEDNAEMVASCLASDGSASTIKYGDVVQLLHVETDLYVNLHRTAAQIDKDCHLVNLCGGSATCYFKITPLYKTRAEGTAVYYDDEVVFESVKHEGLRLHCSHGKEMEYHSAWPRGGDIRGPASLIPQALRSLDTTEVNGGPDRSSFALCRYATYLQGPPSLRTGGMFRIFHPVAEGMVCASCDPDKRKFLKSGRRADGSPAHLPYLKKLDYPDPMHPSNSSAKAVWMFEEANRTTGADVLWERPVYIRHLVSGKYLSVDTSSSELGDDLPELSSGTHVYRCTLVEVPSQSSLFVAISHGSSKEALPSNSPCTLRIVHKLAQERRETSLLAKTTKLYLHHLPMPKSGFVEEGARQRVKTSERLCFIDAKSPKGVLRVIPLDAMEARQIKKISGFIKPLKLYAYLMQNADVANASNPRFPKAALDLVDSVAGILLEAIQEMTAGGSILESRSTHEWMKVASNTLPAKFATMFEGEPSKVAQRIARDTKFIDACFEVSSAPYNRFVKLNGEGKSPFEALPVPANLTAEEQEYFENKEHNARIPPQFISKLAHVCLQRLFQGLEPNQEYFSKRKCLMLNKLEMGQVQSIPKKWTSVISNQSEDPLGATVTLSKLLGSNERISENIVSEDLLKQFLDLIGKYGPQPRLIQLFSSVCVVAGKPITCNQEMVLRMLWMDEVARTASILKLVEIPQRQNPTYGGLDFRRANIEWVPGVPRNTDGSRKQFLGDEEFKANPRIDQVYVEWAGSPDWKEGIRTESLFWDWQKLGIVPKDSQGVQIGSTIRQTKEYGDAPNMRRVEFQISQIPIEWLCWVLEPLRLSQPVTGTQYKEFREHSSQSQRESHKAFKSQCQLAEFFVSQLQLLTNMARGRSYNCITWLTGRPQVQPSDGFSYTMLIGMASNPWLPYIVRSSVIELLLALYVDRYPQLPNSGKPSLPEKLWVAGVTIGDDSDDYEEEKEEENAGGAKTETMKRRLPLLVRLKSSRNEHQRSKKRTTVVAALGRDRNISAQFRMSDLKRYMVGKSVPVIHGFPLTDDAALPKFKISESHLFFEKLDKGDRYTDPILSIDDEFKFYLLRRLCNGIVASFNGGGMVSCNVGQNRLANAALSASSLLLDFGFQSSLEKIKQLVQPAAKLMDGRLDLETPGNPFMSPQNRYRNTGSIDFQVVVAAKKKVIDLLQTVSDYRANYRLARFLSYFQTDKDLNREIHDLYHVKYARGQDMQKFCSESSMAKGIHLEFEKLFDRDRSHPDDATELDLATLTKQPIGELLLDCAMYDDDSLFEQAIKLLDRRFGQRRKLCEVLRNAYILDDDALSIGPFKEVHELKDKLGCLLFTTRSYEVWGVSSMISGNFDEERYTFLKEVCTNIVKLLQTDGSKTGEDGNRAEIQFQVASTDARKRTLTLSPNRRPLKKAPTKLIRNASKSIRLDDTNKEEIGSNEEMQAILQKLDIRSILVAGLMIDFNIAFKGSRCSLNEKLKSQRWLIDSVEHILRLFLAFVRNNKENQKLLFGTLADLTKLCYATVAFPPKPENWSTDGTLNPEKGLYPQINSNSADEIKKLAKLSIIELFRANLHTAARVPQSTIEMFANFIDQSGDATRTRDVESLFVLARPVRHVSIRRNQDMILDQLFRPGGKLLLKMEESVFLASRRTAENATGDTLRMVRLLRTLADQYDGVQKMMQHAGFTVLALVEELTTIFTASGPLSASAGNGVPNSAVAEVLKKPDGEEIIRAQAEEVATYTATVLRLLPKDSEIMRDEKVWNFMSAAELLIKNFAEEKRGHISKGLLEALFTIIASFLSAASSSGLLEEVKRQRAKWQIVSNIAADAKLLPSGNKVLSPELLNAAYNVVIACGQKADAPPPKKGRAPTRTSIAKLERKNIYGHWNKRLKIFQCLVDYNPHIMMSIKRRRFALIEELEEEKAGIKWADFVGRCVRYGWLHYLDNNEEHMSRICTTLRYALLKARTLMSTDGLELIDFNEVNPDLIDDPDLAREYTHALKKHGEQVNILVENGVQELMCAILGSRADDNQGLSLDAFLLCNEMLHHANEATQHRVAQIISNDYDNRFLNSMMNRLVLVQEAVIQNRRLGLVVGDITDEAMEMFSRGISTIEYLRLLCEHHYLLMQNLLRVQNNHAGVVDIVKKSIDIAILLCEDSGRVKALSKIEVELMTTLFMFFAELCQGPCGANQLKLVKSDAAVAMKNVIGGTFNKQGGHAVSEEEGFKLRAAAVTMAKSLLEGREDLQVHSILATNIEVILLMDYLESVKRLAEEATEQIDLLETVNETATDAKTVEAELRRLSFYEEQWCEEQLREEQLLNKQLVVSDSSMADQFEVVEIFWRGRIEQIIFHAPSYCDFLSSGSKLYFLNEEANLSTPERRNMDLLRKIDEFILEMKVSASLDANSKVYRVLDKALSWIKVLTYTCVVLLNLNVLMSSEDLKNPFLAILDCQSCEDTKGLTMTIVLGALVVVGYALIASVLGLKEVSLLIRTVSASSAERTAFPVGAIRDPLKASVVIFVAIGIHSYNYNANLGLYLVMVAALFMWSCRQIREDITLPSSSLFVEGFVICYDLLYEKALFRNYLALLILSILGFKDTKYFTILLLDIFNRRSIRVLQDLVKAFTLYASQLSFVLYIIVITCIIFATFGYRHFGLESYSIGDDAADDLEDEYKCSSVFTCFLFLFYIGVPHEGSISGLMSEVSFGDGVFWSRIIYDLLFFVWMFFILFNVITGLIVDSFAHLREDANFKKDILENSCFICGITRYNYDNKGMSSEVPSFDDHIRGEHLIWKYVNFLSYLKEKNPMDFDGREKFVFDEVKAMSLTWLPNGISRHIELHQSKPQRGKAKPLLGDDGASVGIREV